MQEQTRQLYPNDAGVLLGPPSISVAPTAEPVSLSDQKNYMKSPPSADDALITLLIKAVRSQLEKKLNRAFLNQTLIASFRGPMKFCALPRAPYVASSLSKVEFVVDGTATVQTLTDFFVDDSAHPAILWKNGQGTLYSDSKGYVRVTYQAGYTVSTLPPELQVAVMRIVDDLYEQRGDILVGNAVARAINDSRSMWEHLVVHTI